ncbi:natural product biosynthesis luciferase-like monooxygenase protein [Tumebacillus sp. BK434]|uniref:MupA/Atu3671 family FMN-dependent luciferase-like monooxygenase n=1 Tax=Tumebacillus sp. BK434 TaxID=2512169 RepID=UPI0010535FBF|nr:MupA/Atu3671 family FMN-dependent luciferase-like monooxygenase [Tumebacillus sp. BK434]TCP59163.1 natural product biosynthesis luciferase-like monooxygenase protein [Tumebacillus sp. BK434]
MIDHTLVGLLLRRAGEQPGLAGYTFLTDDGGEERLTYAALDRKARAVAAWLQNIGAAGERALLLYSPGIDYLAAFFGCLYAGVLAVPAYPPRQNGNLERLQAVATDADARFVLTTSGIAAAVEERFHGVTCVVTDVLSEDLAELWLMPDVGRESLAFLQYTSGSTSAPKGVMLSHGNLLHNLSLIEQRFGTTKDSRGVVWLPPYHDMGLIGGILNPLYTGYPMSLMAPVSFIQKPLRWLEAISKTGATVSGGPNFAYELCLQKISEAQRGLLDLSAWQTAFSGAEPVRAETLERFAAFFGSAGFRKEAFFPCYGLAEGTLFVAGGRMEDAPRVRTFAAEELEQNRAVETAAGDGARTLVSSGTVGLTEQDVYVADPETGERCADGAVGEICVQGASVAQGYWQQDDLTQAAFGGGVLRTGDLGFVLNGELFVTGRLKDLIIIRGRNYYPQDVEFAVQESHPAVCNPNGAAFSVDVQGEERLVVVQEIERGHRKGDPTAVIAAIRQQVAAEYQLQVYGVVLLRPASIPKTSSGKVQRHQCKQRFLAGTLEAVASSVLDGGVMDSRFHEAGLPIEGFAEGTGTAGTAGMAGSSKRSVENAVSPVELDREALLGLPSAERYGALVMWLLAETRKAAGGMAVTAEQAFGALGFDSLMAVELKHTLAEKFGVEVELGSLLDGETVAGLAGKVLRQVEAAAETAPVVQDALPAAKREEYPLTYGQRAMWFLQRLDPGNAAYNVARAVRIRSAVNLQALQDAFNELVKRHAVLRTVCTLADGVPVQRVTDENRPVLSVQDAAAWSGLELAEVVSEAANRPFDLEHGPLLRATLFARGAEESVLLLTLHHLVIDFWSLEVMMEELWTVYEAEVHRLPHLLEQPVAEYADYVNWQQKFLGGPRGEQLLSYWKQRLAGAAAVLQLPTDHPRPAIQTYRGTSLRFELPATLSERVKRLAQEQGVTLFTLLLTAYQVLLHRYSGQEDILVGSPMAGRSNGQFAKTVGYFANPVVLRAQLTGEMRFAELLSQGKRTVLQALDHQAYPFALLVEQLQPPRDPSCSPLFQVTFALQKSHVLGDDGVAALSIGQSGAEVQAGGLLLESMEIPQAFVQFDLALAVAEVEGKLSGTFEYNADLFAASTIERMAGHFETLLAGIVRDADQKVAELPLLTEAERRQLLVEWNATETAVNTGLCMHQLFEAQAALAPDRTAVVFEADSISYGELNRRANLAAHHLRTKGVGPDVLVGICMERSLEMMIGLLAILKAGGAYVPLDPTYPQERLAFLLTDAQVPVLLTQERLLDRLPGGSAAVLALDAWLRTAQGDDSNLSSGVTSANTAYAIYTSGTTGQPKGVLVEHRNAVNFFAGMDQRIGCAAEDTLLAVTSICFDISVLELFWTLARGAKVVLLSEAEAGGGLARGQRQPGNGMDFSLFYFANDEENATDDKYRLLLDGAKYADANGFKAVWTPERHFHQFGGLYPSPAVMSSALAMVTERVELRAGSVVLPLHHPIRVAEEWSVIDNLSKGRVSLSFASGWHADDFVFAPENYPARTDVMFDNIELVKKLWRGETHTFTGGAGNEVKVKILPRPVQPELPVWITSGGNKETFIRAGQIGANVLTHLLGQTVAEVAEKIQLYREARAQHGHDPQSGRVALMLHTFVGDNMDMVRETVRAPFTAYLRTSVGLIENLVRALNLDINLKDLSPEDMDGLLNMAFDRYFDTGSLFGTPETCRATVDRLQQIGVDEIACLIDFGIAQEAVLNGLEALNGLRAACLAHGGGEQTGDYSIAAQAKAHGATMMQCTPSLMRILTADSSNVASLQGLQKLLLGGEALPPAQAAALRAALPAKLVNLYGPTEATVWATTHEVQAGAQTVPIGKPFANMQAYVLDGALQPVPAGLPGELFIGGAGVARGYLRRDQLTAESFVPNPFGPGRLYRTGDLATWSQAGELLFLGRIDHQVKVRGFRIELGEIEAALEQLAGVQEAVVTAREDAAGEKYIAAYVVKAEAAALTAKDLQDALAARLPAYMVPASLMFLDAMPLTPNGKVDRKALPNPVQERAQLQAVYAAPQSKLEQTLSQIWQDVLRIDRVGVHDNFFELGGHSILAVQVHGQIKAQLGADLPIVQLFQYPTIAGLAKYLNETDSGEQDQALVQKGLGRAESRRESLKQRSAARATTRTRR